MLRSALVRGLLVSLCLFTGGAVATAQEGHRESRVVENLFDAKLLDGGLGWVVGAFGAIYKTTDGGKTWAPQKTPTLDYLYAVDFDTPQRGVVVGKSGTILTTEDGGTTWVLRPSGTDRNLFSVSYASGDSVWAVGDWGAIVHSADGGKTWTDRSLEDDIVLTAVDFVDENHGLAAGEFGTVRYTRDGGKTFESPQTGTDKTFFGAAMTGPEELWLVGIDGLILRSRDGGRAWEVKRGVLETSSLDQVSFKEVMANPGLYDISFSGSFGYVVGDVGMVLVSSDRGDSWVEHKLPPEMSLFWIRGVSAAGEDRAIVAGANGLTAGFEKEKVQLGDRAS
jgi:photosystem II stability/assembly factor-like uncharacterized protein